MQTFRSSPGCSLASVVQTPLALALALGLGATPLAGMAATIAVTTPDDAGGPATCTLRQALVSMNTGATTGTGCVNTGTGFHDVDYINFDAATFPNGGANLITLADASGSTLTVSDNNLTIDASANGQVTIRRPSGATKFFGLISQVQAGGGSLVLKNLVLTNGYASRGGAVDNALGNGTLTLINCRVTGNRAGSGGGIASDGHLYLISSTVDNNVAQPGGGIYSRNTVHVTNSTITGNVSISDYGGGIWGALASIQVTNSTITGNSADRGGGIYTYNSIFPHLTNTIVAGNSSGDLYADPVGSGNFIGGDPRLRPLADNGGPTPTMMPFYASPVLDAIACTNAPATDQRGVARPQGAQCDIGAVEAKAIDVPVPPTITKAFSPSTVHVGDSTTLTFTISNPNATSGLTGVAFTDSLPAGMVVATPNGLTKTCSGTATAVAGASSAGLSGGILAANASCTMSIGVTVSTIGAKENSVQATSDSTGAGQTSKATLTVTPLAPTIEKVFGAAAIPLNNTTSLTFTLENPNASAALTGVGFTDFLPAGLVVATPNGLTKTCDGVAIASAGATGVILSNATLAGGASCSLAVNVQATTLGAKDNSVQVVSSEAGFGNTSHAFLTVGTAAPTIAAVFDAATIYLANKTQLTFNLSNPNAAAALTDVAFTDDLPAGLVIATPNGLTNTCGGTATAVAGTASASLSGASLAGAASCAMAVDVTGATLGRKDNAVQVSFVGGSGNTSNSTLWVALCADSDTIFCKGFEPGAISPIGGPFDFSDAIALDIDGSVLVADDFRIKVISPPDYATSLLTNLTNDSNGIALDAAGNLISSNFPNSSVEKRLAANGYATYTEFGNGVLNHPNGVAVDASGNVFVADTSNGAVRRMLAPGYATIDTLGSGFSTPYGIALDDAGNVYVADSGRSSVYKILAAGNYATVVPLGSGFAGPRGIAVDGQGNVYVADTGNQAVREILAPAYTVITPLGSGFSLPTGVAVDAQGNVYVVDAGSNQVKVIVR